MTERRRLERAAIGPRLLKPPPAIQKTPPCFWEVHVPEEGGGGARPHPSTGGTKARPADHASHFVSIRHSAWPSPDNGRRRVRSKMCDGRRHGVVRVGKRGLAGLWGHERGRVQAAPKHGVHGLAQRSNPYGKHPFQDVRRPAAWGRADEAMATGNTAAPCWRLKARPRSRHRTAAPTGSPKNNRDQAIGRSAGWGRSPTGGLSVGLRRAAPR